MNCLFDVDSLIFIASVQMGPKCYCHAVLIQLHCLAYYHFFNHHSHDLKSDMYTFLGLFNF